MSQTDDLNDLMQSAFQARQSALKKTRAQIQGMRDQLIELDELAASSSVKSQADHAQNRLGAGLAWQIFLEKQRAGVMNSLALAKAQEANQKELLRQSFGKVQATQKLKEISQFQRQKKQKTSEETRLGELIAQTWFRV